MPKARLIERDSILESDLIETMLAGHKSYRPDLSYPESHSDMQACARALMQMYEIKRRPIAQPLKYQCAACNGIGERIAPQRQAEPGERLDLVPSSIQSCADCRGKGWVEGS